MKLTSLLLIILFCLPAPAGPIIKRPFKKRVIFTSSTTWTVPAGVTKIRGDVWGGGGGAGACNWGSYGATGSTGGSSSLVGFVTVTGGAGGGGSDVQYCNWHGSGGAGGTCTTTDAYQCYQGAAGPYYQDNGSCGDTVIPGGTTTTAKTPWGVNMIGPSNGAATGHYGGQSPGGGGGGGYATGTFTVTPAQVITVTVGGGGAGASGTYCNGGAGTAGKIVIWY